MTIWEDTRNKKGKHEHIRKYCDYHQIEIIRKKLDVGDYQTPGGNISVDTKASIEEISGNLTNPTDKQRFMREVRRSRQLGLRLVVLVETNKYKAVKDLASWKSKYTPVRGTVLIREMERLRYAYGVEFRFCPKMSAAKKIIDILTEKE